MALEEAFELFGTYDLWLIILGLAFFATSALPRVITSYTFSTPIVLFILGYVVVALPLGLEAPDPIEEGEITERLTEIGVILALMGAGLKIDRRFSFKGWNITWRLLGITMILSIGLTALLGIWIMAFVPATAILLGAVMAPTDPVLAAEVQVGSPGEGAKDRESEDEEEINGGEEDEVRFSLTSEAGLNDGLAFPFTNMAVAMVLFGAAPENWFTAWILVDVLYKMAVAIVVGIVLGYFLGVMIMKMPAETHLAKSMIGLSALATTLFIYGVTQFLGGYGFIAVFLGALMIRNYDMDHDYHKHLHIVNDKIEHVLMAIILISFGAALAGNLLEPLNWQIVLSALIIIFIVRPVSGLIALIGFKNAPWREKLAISFLGIRGIGSFYYLAYALNEAYFPGEREIWALVSLVVVISIFLHGISAAPITDRLDRMRSNGVL